MNQDAHPAIRAAAELAGGQARLANLLEVTPPTVSQWSSKERPVPIPRCVEINRAFKSVKLWELRPEDWHRIWPELIGTPGAPKVPKAKPARVVAA